MAEGGEDDKDNPFSFKNFIQKKDKSKKVNANTRKDFNDDCEVVLPDVSNMSRQRASAIVEATDEPPQTSNSKQKKKSGDENPFSFKKFLECSSNGARSKTSQKPRLHKNGSLSQNTPDLATDLPDFVQDRYSDQTSARARPADAGLPDFCFPSESLSNPSESRERTNSGNYLPDFTVESSHIDSVTNTKRFQDDLTSVNRSNSIDNDKALNVNSDIALPSRTSKQRVEKKPVSLPDFLSDSVFNSQENYSDTDFLPSSSSKNTTSKNAIHTTTNSVTVLEVNGDLELECRKLREENQNLRLQLEEAKQEAVSETQRCHKMKKEMETIQKKEAEETSALEKMMQQVEANLITTTQRAVSAENNVSRLQGEVKSLQNQLARVRSENEMLQSGDRGLADMKERTSYAAQQLSNAATTAEQNLRQLLSGVESLKIVAKVLESIDKIREQTEEQEPNKETDHKKDETSTRDKSKDKEDSKEDDT